MLLEKNPAFPHGWSLKFLSSDKGLGCYLGRILTLYQLQGSEWTLVTKCYLCKDRSKLSGLYLSSLCLDKGFMAATFLFLWHSLSAASIDLWGSRLEGSFAGKNWGRKKKERKAWKPLIFVFFFFFNRIIWKKKLVDHLKTWSKCTKCSIPHIFLLLMWVRRFLDVIPVSMVVL